MGRPTRSLLALLCCVLLADAAHGGVESTVHNLAASGPGPLRAPEVANVCVFCHTPHNANPTRGLWNHELPGVTYILYESSTTEAELEQPTGSSRLCLSCHDGTLALGALRRTAGGVQPALGPLVGEAVLGTDLSDDHPVSFVYDSHLALRSGGLLNPGVLPRRVKLDETGQLQCTSCHDPHEDRIANFLVLEPRFGGLCLACHRPDGWVGSSHATSTAMWSGAGTDPWPGSEFGTVAENACENCHRPHAALHPERLLSAAREEEVCLVCHEGSVAAENVGRDFRKASVHPVESLTGIHDPRESPLGMNRHVACQDCHDPHQATALAVQPPGVPGASEGVSGVSAGGGPTTRATFGYEVCFKCHGITEEPAPIVIRADNVTNSRLELATTNASYHPVIGMGRNATITGFEPGYAATSVIACTDCHNSDSGRQAGGTGPDGPHGSHFEPILEREYYIDGGEIGESFSTYRLCYKCHNRSAVLSQSSPFLHAEHVQDARSSCAACHDGHGSRGAVALINFMTRDRSGQQVVTASASGRLEFQSLGRGSGRCFLTCHGENHDPLEYGVATGALRGLGSGRDRARKRGSRR